MMKRNSNKNKKNTVIITINGARERHKKRNLIKCGGWVVYAETVTYKCRHTFIPSTRDTKHFNRIYIHE